MAIAICGWVYEDMQLLKILREYSNQHYEIAELLQLKRHLTTVNIYIPRGKSIENDKITDTNTNQNQTSTNEQEYNDEDIGDNTHKEIDDAIHLIEMEIEKQMSKQYSNQI